MCQRRSVSQLAPVTLILEVVKSCLSLLKLALTWNKQTTDVYHNVNQAWYSCATKIQATHCLLLSCDECVFAVIVVAGKDETALCNFNLKLPTDGSEHYRQWLTLLQLKEMLASMTRTKTFSFSLCNSESLQSCPVHWALWITLRSEMADREKKKKHSRERQETSFFRHLTNWTRDLTQCLNISVPLLPNPAIKPPWLWFVRCLTVIWCCVLCSSWVQDTVSRRGGLQTKSHHRHLGRSDGNMPSDTQLTHTHPQCHWVFPFSLWQTSTSARSCQACAREDSASTLLAASSANVPEDTPSTQKPESVKVLHKHRWPIPL